MAWGHKINKYANRKSITDNDFILRLCFHPIQVKTKEFDWKTSRKKIDRVIPMAIQAIFSVIQDECAFSSTVDWFSSNWRNMCSVRHTFLLSYLNWNIISQYNRNMFCLYCVCLSVCVCMCVFIVLIRFSRLYSLFSIHLIQWWCIFQATLWTTSTNFSAFEHCNKMFSIVISSYRSPEAIGPLSFGSSR